MSGYDASARVGLGPDKPLPGHGRRGGPCVSGTPRQGPGGDEAGAARRAFQTRDGAGVPARWPVARVRGGRWPSLIWQPNKEKKPLAVLRLDSGLTAPRLVCRRPSHRPRDRGGSRGRDDLPRSVGRANEGKSAPPHPQRTIPMRRHRDEKVPVTFKVEKELAEMLGQVGNRSEFIRKAIIAKLDLSCPLFVGTRIGLR